MKHGMILASNHANDMPHFMAYQLQAIMQSLCHTFGIPIAGYARSIEAKHMPYFGIPIAKHRMAYALHGILPFALFAEKKMETYRSIPT